jgi:hypothetical protein
LEFLGDDSYTPATCTVVTRQPPGDVPARCPATATPPRPSGGDGTMPVTPYHQGPYGIPVRSCSAEDSSMAGRIAGVGTARVKTTHPAPSLRKPPKLLQKPLQVSPQAATRLFQGACKAYCSDAQALARRLQSAFKALARRLSLYCASIARLCYGSSPSLAHLFTSSSQPCAQPIPTGFVAYLYPTVRN